MAKAISTYKTYLMSSTDGSTYTKLIDIISFPDLGGEPETIETTTLSDKMQTFIPGVESNDNMTFEANYTPENYAAIKALDDGEEHHLAVFFGGDGDNAEVTNMGKDGKFKFDGYVRPQISGGGVNDRVQMNIIVTPSTPVEEITA